MSNEWYTPAKYIEAARAVMGSIDLDPASCELANQTVRAARYYTQEDNGLAQEWFGNVWLNPPFEGTYLREIWVKRLVEDYERGTINQAILCMPAAIETQWFQPLWNYPICFPSSRINFYQEKMEQGSPNFAACLVYMGNRAQKFIEVFSKFGRIAKAIDVKADKPRQLELVS